ncbi:MULTISPECIES: DUF1127 domain-containing protein [Serratia]|nr:MULTISPECIES: DUF1127 domain-containing protein [Serratia]MBH2661707.1 DUF1127 domain-containing protein [Serratia ureilytica]MBH3007756.1 DUF1127 domain-containing protein [Serratia ureilytica]MBH3107714.1 DUF1127 domain-containing protein [Serratia ureilytica]MBH3121272.1 DUF1127 domain-containing protein [Serratia ureilytica]MBN5281866.1 DUF1127 domain-containing protein [Serratia ureilytica]
MALFDGMTTWRRVGWSRWRWYLLRLRTRRELLLLNDRQLADIGLTRADAWREGYKPFWRE